MKQSILFIAAIIGIFFASCKKSNDASPQHPTVAYQVKATNTSYSVAKTTSAANITWTSAIAYPDVVKFEASQDNLQVEFKSTNKDAIDLMAPLAVTFGSFVLPAGTYNKIELKIDLDKNGTLPVLQLNGHFSNGTLTLPVSIVITRSVELETEQHDVVITDDNSYTAVTTIDLSALTSGITTNMILNATLSGGAVLISADSNRGLYDVVLDHLEHEHHHCEFEHHHH